jgi:predicted nucleotidyltransferase
MSIKKVLVEKREEILNIASHYGATNIRIFGSVARGMDTESSDVDILVKFDKNRSLLDHAALINEMEDLLGRKVDIVTESGLKDRHKERILSEAEPL